MVLLFVFKFFQGVHSVYYNLLGESIFKILSTLALRCNAEWCFLNAPNANLKFISVEYRCLADVDYALDKTSCDDALSWVIKVDRDKATFPNWQFNFF